ncbi:MAG: hypothetical protein KGL44_02620 [Sphingomonadales bacterium]|nr:hypothetical protein [Sphingomonadales bacterium]
MTDKPRARRRKPVAAKPAFAAWTKAFLSELAATSNVSASAKKAGVSTSTAYDTRRANPEFHRRWMEALCEGYDHLEMDLLLRLRTGEIKPAAGAKKGVRTFDNATAYRLLAAHRDSAGRQRAIRSRADADAIVESINAKLQLMRQRALAAPGKDADADTAG